MKTLIIFLLAVAFLAICSSNALHAEYQYSLNLTQTGMIPYAYSTFTDFQDSLVIFYHFDTQPGAVLINYFTMNQSGQFSEVQNITSVEVEGTTNIYLKAKDDKLLIFIHAYIQSSSVYNTVVLQGTTLLGTYLDCDFYTDLWNDYLVNGGTLYNYITGETQTLGGIFSNSLIIGNEYLVLDGGSDGTTFQRKIYDTELNIINSYIVTIDQNPIWPDISTRPLEEWLFGDPDTRVYQFEGSNYLYDVGNTMWSRDLLNTYIEEDTLHIILLGRDSAEDNTIPHEFYDMTKFSSNSYYTLGMSCDQYWLTKVTFSGHTTDHQSTQVDSLPPSALLRLTDKLLIMTPMGNVINLRLYDQNHVSLVNYLHSGVSPYFGVFSKDNFLYIMNGSSYNFIRLDSTLSVTENTSPYSPIRAEIYPNPFHEQTNIKLYGLNKSPCKISVFNIKGQLVNTLTPSDIKQDNLNLVWKPSDHSGKKLASGVYFLKIQNNNSQLTKKVLIMK